MKKNVGILRIQTSRSIFINVFNSNQQ